MRLEPIMTQIETAIEAQLRLADPSVADAATDFLEAFWPVVRTAILDAVQQAAAEIDAQLGDRSVEVRLTGGDPELVVTQLAEDDVPLDEDLEARLTLRLPPSLKSIIEDAATSTGDSINSWVVDALRSRTRRSGAGSRVEETFEL